MDETPEDLAERAGQILSDLVDDDQDGIYGGKNQSEKRRIFAVRYAGMVCEQPQEIKQMAMWVDRFIRNGKGGPIQD